MAAPATGLDTRLELKLAKLPPLPAIAMRLMKLIEKENVSFKEVSDLIRSDVAYSVEVLRLANSSLIGARFQVKSILDAISMLGMERLRALVLTVALTRFTSAVAKTEIFRQCWRHNLAAALLCEEFATVLDQNKANAYTAGLLHDIGRLALLVAHPAEYAALVKALGEPGLDLLQLEKETFGSDHCAVGGWLADRWGLPAEFRDIAASHHKPVPDEDQGILRLVSAGCAAANLLGFGFGGHDEHARLEELLPAAIALLERPEFPQHIAERINSVECSQG